MTWNDKQIHRRIEILWKFIRGDLPVRDFEQWVYAESTLEHLLGETLYFETISVNYSEKDAVYTLKQHLSKFATQTFPQSCQCMQLSDIAVVDMGDESQRVFQHLVEVTRRGDPYWWLSVEQCRECDQVWLVASEERQNDVYCLHRLDHQTLEGILTKNHWPAYFETYEELLRLGVETGRRVSFLDPFDCSLSWTIADLARERPGIHVSEIAQLLNLDFELARELSQRVICDEGVQITVG